MQFMIIYEADSEAPNYHRPYMTSEVFPHGSKL